MIVTNTNGSLYGLETAMPTPLTKIVPIPEYLPGAYASDPTPVIVMSAGTTGGFAPNASAAPVIANIVPIPG